MEAHEGGLLEFSKGYRKFGFQNEAAGIRYREWIPNAAAVFLFGDFSTCDTVLWKTVHRC